MLFRSRDTMAPDETPDEGPVDLDNVPELGLSEDVFAATPGDDPAPEAEAPSEEPAPAAPDAAVEAPAPEASAVDEAEEPTE